jgi:hypothetical protein
LGKVASDLSFFSADRLKLISQLEFQTRNRVRRKFEHASRGKMRSADAKWFHVFNEFDDPHLAIEKDRVDRKEHPESMDAVARAQPKSFIWGKTAAKHQSTQPGQESICQNYSPGNAPSGRLMVYPHLHPYRGHFLRRPIY